MSGSAQGNIRKGVRLSFLNTLLAGVIQFGIMTVLARLLSPPEYGVYALCLAIASLSATFVTNVVERALVLTHAETDERDKTFLIGALCVAASTLAAGICVALNQIGMTKIDIELLLLLCGASIVNAAAIAPRVWLRREIRFGPIALAETGGLVLGQGATAIALAAAGWGAYSLVAGTLAQSLLIVFLLRLYAPQLPFAFPSPQRVVALIRSCAAMGSTAAIEIINGQVAPLMLGTRVGPAALGLFNRSYSLIQMPIQLLVSSMGRVMISSLFAVREDKVRLRSMSRTLTRVTAVMVTPVAAGMAGASENFVRFAFGPKWLAAAEIMPLLALSAWATMLGTLFALMAEAMHAFAAKARTQALSTALLVVLGLSGTTMGVFGGVVGIAASSCLFLLMFARLSSRLLDLPIGTLLGWLVPGLVVGLPCLIISLTIGNFAHGPSILVFAAQVGGCGVAAGAMLLLAYPSIALQVAEGAAPGVLRLVPWLSRHLRHAAAMRET